MDSRLTEGLLAGQGKKGTKEYQRKLQSCQNKIRLLRNKNNQLQKESDNELEQDIRASLREQNNFIEIGKLKKLLQELGSIYKDPESKNRIKNLWREAGKEIVRNKRIMEDIINRGSFLGSSSKNMTKRKSKPNTTQSQIQTEDEPRLAHLTSNSQILKDQHTDNQIILQQRLQRQRNQLLKELENKNEKINRLYLDMQNEITGEQGDLIDHIDRNMEEVRANVVVANEQLDQAQTLQKRSKKKCYIILAILVIVSALVGTIVFFTTR